MTVASLPKALGSPRQQDRIDRVRHLLARHFGPSKLLVGADECDPYRRDASEAEADVPAAVVLASTKKDIELALSCAAEAEVPLVPRSGGTGKTGGAVPSEGGIVLSTLGLDQIKDIDPRESVAVVEPGVILSHLHAAARAQGLFYPPDPNSKIGCTIGGNVATNAGGPRAFKYGVTGRYVLGIEAFLMGGQRLFTGRRTAKGVTGYDVASLLVGSEGTLAVFGDITLRLIRPPESTLTLLIPFEHMADAARSVMAIVAAGLLPSCLELLDVRLLDGLAGSEFGTPSFEIEAFLLIEVDGTEQACESLGARLAALCEAEGSLEAKVAQDPARRDRMWAARADMSATLRRSARHKLSEDVAVPRRALLDLLNALEGVSRRRAIRMVAYGHAGDGNLHVNFLWDEPEEAPRVHAAIAESFEHVIALGGTLSGEHGIGVLKAPYLHLEQSNELIALQRAMKQAFDPRNLLNPGKIFPPLGRTPG
jgi:glycolate oxidase